MIQTYTVSITWSHCSCFYVLFLHIVVIANLRVIIKNIGNDVTVCKDESSCVCLAQSVELLPLDHKVAGSNPGNDNFGI